MKNENYKKDVSKDVSKDVIKYSQSDYPLLAILMEKNKHEEKDVLPMYKSKCKNPLIHWIDSGEIIENYLQIFKTDFSNLKDKKKKAIEHLMEIENTLWNGERNLCPACGRIIRPSSNVDKPSVRKMGGVIQFLKEGAYKLKKNFSKKDFYDFLRKGFAYGDSTKMLFVDKKSFKYLSKLLKVKFPIKSCAPYYFNSGNTFNYISLWGDVNVIKASSLKSTICLLDMNDVCYCYLNNRNTFIRTNLQKLAFQDVDCKNDKEYRKIQRMRKELKPHHFYATECGLKLFQPDNHLLGIIK